MRKIIFIVCISLLASIPAAAGWQQSQDGRWWYQESDGCYRNEWQEINGKIYYFNSEGYMQTGWLMEGNHWYYLEPGSGARLSGWIYDAGWYYLNSNGHLQTGWLEDRGTWYFADGAGKMVTGWLKQGESWYYLNSNGGRETGWIYDNGWYYLNASGQMMTGWILDRGKWYYLNESGLMVTGWLKYNSVWYFLHMDGQMAVNTWIGDTYFINSSGIMVTDTWINGVYVNKKGEKEYDKKVSTKKYRIEPKDYSQAELEEIAQELYGQYREQIYGFIEMVNDHRDEYNQKIENQYVNSDYDYDSRLLDDLIYTDKMILAACYRSAEQAMLQTMSNIRPDGSGYQTIFDQYGIDYTYSGESEAFSQTDIEELFDDLESSNHKSNFLSSSFQRIGAGVCFDEKGKAYWTILYSGQ